MNIQPHRYYNRTIGELADAANPNRDYEFNNRTYRTYDDKVWQLSHNIAVCDNLIQRGENLFNRNGRLKVQLEYKLEQLHSNEILSRIKRYQSHAKRTDEKLASLKITDDNNKYRYNYKYFIKDKERNNITEKFKVMLFGADDNDVIHKHLRRLDKILFSGITITDYDNNILKVIKQDSVKVKGIIGNLSRQDSDYGADNIIGIQFKSQDDFMPNRLVINYSTRVRAHIELLDR